MSHAERQHPRYAHDVAVAVHLDDRVVAGRTRNVSRGGLCANVVAEIPIGKDVIVDITLVFEDDSQSEALRLPARVAWCTTIGSEYQIGVSFKPLDASRASYLQLFLKYLGDDKPAKQPRVKPSVDDQFG